MKQAFILFLTLLISVYCHQIMCSIYVHRLFPTTVRKCENRKHVYQLDLKSERLKDYQDHCPETITFQIRAALYVK